MKFRLFWVVFAVTISVMMLVSLRHRDTTAGAVTQCDREVSCTAERFFKFDNSWLCCEDDSGWPISHLINPLAITIITGQPIWTFVLFFYFEAFEIDAESLAGTFVFVPADATNRETLAGSLIADAQIQGALGAMLGYSISLLVGWPGFLAYHEKMTHYVEMKYVLLVLLSALTFIPGGLIANTFNYGLLITLALQTLLAFVIIPWSISKHDLPGYDFRPSYARVKWLWILTLLPIVLTGLVPRFLVNYYYPLWIVAVGLILLYQAVYYARHTVHKSVLDRQMEDRIASPK